MPHAFYIFFFFVLGSCVGSFLNVVVWRLPQVEFTESEGFFRRLYRVMTALSDPPSHCPKCNKPLKWYDNLPIVGWFKLGGKCRYCKETISARYPVIEALTGAIFAGYYIAFFVYQVGPCRGVNEEGQVLSHVLWIDQQWWLYLLDMGLLSGLLAASLIDAELFMIPLEIPWILATAGVIAHGVFDTPTSIGSLVAGPLAAALAFGAALGFIVSVILLRLKILPRSFAEGQPMLEFEREESAKKSRATSSADEQPEEWPASKIRREICKEMLFLLPPLFLGMLFTLLVWRVRPAANLWALAMQPVWIRAVLGSVLGGLAGGFVVWMMRILGTLAFGREAMGIGDADLMVGVGAVLGAGPAIAAFFLAPFFGILFGLYMLITRKKHEIPYGPYLSLATAFVMLSYCHIEAYFAPGISNGAWLIGRLFSGG